MTMQDLLDHIDRLGLVDETMSLRVLSNLCRRLRPGDRSRDVGLGADPTQGHGGGRDVESTGELAQVMSDATPMDKEPTAETIVARPQV